MRDQIEFLFFAIVIACLVIGTYCGSFIGSYEYPHECVTDLPDDR